MNMNHKSGKHENFHGYYMQLAMRWMLAAFLVFAAMAKLLTPWSNEFDLGYRVYYVSAIAELSLGVLLLVSATMVVSEWMLAIFALLGSILLHMRSDVVGSCGCLGSIVELDRWDRAMIMATIGAVSAMLIFVGGEERAPGT